MGMLEQVKLDIENALSDWEKDGKPSYVDAIRLEERRRKKNDAELLKRKRELEARIDLERLLNGS